MLKRLGTAETGFCVASENRVALDRRGSKQAESTVQH